MCVRLIGGVCACARARVCVCVCVHDSVRVCVCMCSVCVCVCAVCVAGGGVTFYIYYLDQSIITYVKRLQIKVVMIAVVLATSNYGRLKRRRLFKL